MASLGNYFVQTGPDSGYAATADGSAVMTLKEGQIFYCSGELTHDRVFKTDTGHTFYWSGPVDHLWRRLSPLELLARTIND